MGIRIHRYLAICGIASRRKAEDLIREGRVRVNGNTLQTLGVIITPGVDRVTVDEVEVFQSQPRIRIMLHKPEGYVSTVQDPQGRPTVLSLIQMEGVRLFPVGRLDMDTSGLLILTNDGDFSQEITHPSRNISKVYIARIRGIPDASSIRAFREGIDIGGYVTWPAEMKILSRKGDISTVQVTIHEGKNRQIRRMVEALRFEVLELKRISIGNLSLGSLPPGKWRILSETDIRAIFSA